MSPQAGFLLQDQIVPRLCSAIPKSILCVGAEDHHELIQDATVMAAKMIDRAESQGKLGKVSASNIAYYTLQHLKSGRRANGTSSVDIMASATQLNGSARLHSMNEVVSQSECGDEIFELQDVIKQVKAYQTRGTSLRYLRYCDDMVLIAARKWKCKLAYEVYLRALDELKLPYHPANNIKRYGKKFWSDKNKSKAPYCWSGETKPGHVPWVQFVGYQVRFDGWVRPKPKSVKKQLNALKDTVDKVKWELLRRRRQNIPKPAEKPPIVVTRAQTENSLASKLVSMGVGRVNINKPHAGPFPMCWCNGFKALYGKPIVPTFLKRLDRERERQLRRFKRAEIHYGFGRAARSSGSRKAPRGFLSSYYAQFKSQ